MCCNLTYDGSSAPSAVVVFVVFVVVCRCRALDGPRVFRLRSQVLCRYDVDESLANDDAVTAGFCQYQFETVEGESSTKGIYSYQAGMSVVLTIIKDTTVRVSRRKCVTRRGYSLWSIGDLFAVVSSCYARFVFRWLVKSRK